jgi:hypothetical protein
MASTTPKPRELIQAWAPGELVEQLRERAAAADRTLSAELRQAVRGHLGRELDSETATR